MDILKVLEKEALYEATEWAKNEKVTTGEYPDVEKFFQKKEEILFLKVNRVYRDLGSYLKKRRNDERIKRSRDGGRN